ncbi:thiamine phosphate synthase [Exiguobacterium acetylicum]|uniref:thiamine phosphate synthase n=1 Tax=Exiguobacterium acetylicum TaxID=41170 RepID=UPI00067FC5E6|nr:thiamine phosphate synthase [Exiguobacterium acetylicum]KNH37495.1 transcriptional regulator [Exiguobacterium acetylicum]
MMRLHLISTGSIHPLDEIKTFQSLQPYTDQLHLREPNLSAAELLDLIDALLAHGYSSDQLTVHDRVDVAHVAGIGVQLTRRSLRVRDVRLHFPNLVIGKSVHSLAEALAAEAEGADRLLYGHIYPTASKPNVPPRGIDALKQVVTFTTKPVIAIGGITPDRIPEIAATGATGIAVLSGILGQADPLAAVHRYQEVRV